MLNLPELDPMIANAVYMELRDCISWLFTDDSEEMLAGRRYALAKVETLRPANAIEASLAARAVAHDFHGMDSLRLAAGRRDDLKTALQCRNQANAMAREASRTVAQLKQLQQARRLNEAAAPAMEPRFPRDDGPDGTTADEPIEMDIMPSARSQAVTPSAPSQAAADQASPGPAIVPAAAPPAAPATPECPPSALAKAERFACQNRALAMRIRRAGGLTAAATAGFRRSALPTERAVVQALVYGNTPLLAALDGVDRQDRQAA